MGEHIDYSAYILIYMLMLFPIVGFNYDTPLDKVYLKIRVNKIIRIILFLYKKFDKIGIFLLLSQFALVCNIIIVLIYAFFKIPELLYSILRMNKYGFSSLLFFIQYGFAFLETVDACIYDIIERIIRKKY